MWKTPSAKPVWKVDAGVVVLCPQCDALGPHPIEAQAVACIDCGERLGRLLPEGFAPFDRDLPTSYAPTRSVWEATTAV